jgi:hypothetical protein
MKYHKEQIYFLIFKEFTMHKKLSIAVVTGLSLLGSLSYAETNSMMFKNERGSVLELNLMPDNKLEGYFTTAVASKTCPEAIQNKRPIIGYVAGNTLTFSVVYPSCGSVVSITGNFMQDKKGIDTIAIVNHQSNDISHEGPGARFISHDSYKKMG